MENLPIILLEAMAVGLPADHRGPMPEVLKDAGVYFNLQTTNFNCCKIEGASGTREDLAKVCEFEKHSLSFSTHLHGNVVLIVGDILS